MAPRLAGPAHAVKSLRFQSGAKYFGENIVGPHGKIKLCRIAIPD